MIMRSRSLFFAGRGLPMFMGRAWRSHGCTLRPLQSDAGLRAMTTLVGVPAGLQLRGAMPPFSCQHLLRKLLGRLGAALALSTLALHNRPLHPTACGVG